MTIFIVVVMAIVGLAGSISGLAQEYLDEHGVQGSDSSPVPHGTG
jgi:hypothetical protein